MDKFVIVLSAIFLGAVSGNTLEVKHLEDNGLPEVRLYYESMCPGCRRFDSTYFAELVSKLGPYLNIHTYPYGKASTTVYYNGTVKFSCQHGPAECHGNMLHACVVDNAAKRDQALLFNACLMDLKRTDNGSNDASLDECGSNTTIDLKAVKDCAHGDRGIELLKNIGEESFKAHYTSLPHVLINGQQWKGDHKDLIKDVCKAFKHPPEPCRAAEVKT